MNEMPEKKLGNKTSLAEFAVVLERWQEFYEQCEKVTTKGRRR